MVQTPDPAAAKRRRVPVFTMVMVAAGAILTGTLLAVLSSSGGSGYGLDIGADRSHELAGIRSAATILSQQTHGTVEIDTSPASVVFVEEKLLVTANVQIGRCRVGGQFWHVRYSTNGPLQASDLWPLRIVNASGSVVLELTDRGTLHSISASPLAHCLTRST